MYGVILVHIIIMGVKRLFSSQRQAVSHKITGLNATENIQNGHWFAENCLRRGLGAPCHYNAKSGKKKCRNTFLGHVITCNRKEETGMDT